MAQTTRHEADSLTASAMINSHKAYKIVIDFKYYINQKLTNGASNYAIKLVCMCKHTWKYAGCNKSMRKCDFSYRSRMKIANWKFFLASNERKTWKARMMKIERRRWWWLVVKHVGHRKWKTIYQRNFIIMQKFLYFFLVCLKGNGNQGMIMRFYTFLFVRHCFKKYSN